MFSLLLAVTPGPTGPAAPAEVDAKVTLALNFGWYSVLAVCFGMALWGCATLAVATKRQSFSGVNEGKKTLFFSIAGAAAVSVLRGLFVFFGV